MKTVRLNGVKAAGRLALVDDEDYELVMAYRWHVQEYVLPSGTKIGPYATTYQPGPARRRPQADQACIVCGQRPAMARRACRPCYRKYWKAGRLGELAPAKPRLGGGRTIRMHSLIAGFAEVDHWNGDGLDNTRKNLRDVTHQQNTVNRPSCRGSASRYKGVFLHVSGKWKAEFNVDGHRHYLGLFTSEEDAARAYDAISVATHGSYARPNFPDGEMTLW